MASGTSLNATLNMAVRAMQISQTQLGTTSHNISNVNSEGYVRQEVIQESYSIQGFGAGAQIDAIRQVVDRILQNNIAEQNSAVGYANAVNSALESVQALFGTPGAPESLEKQINAFFNDLNTLANSPDSAPLQLNVVNTAAFITDSLNSSADLLATEQIRINGQIDTELNTINNALEKIFELNQQIVTLSIDSDLSGSNANDLIDERQRQINIISERLNVNVINDSAGRARLSTETGRNLVGENYVQLERIPGTPPAVFDDIGIRPQTPNGTPSTSVYPVGVSSLTDGSIKGLIDVRDQEIPNLLAELDELANSFRTTFNRLHSQGTGIPPKSQFTSGNGNLLSGAGADLTAELGINAGDTFDISIVTTVDGQPVSTTQAGGVPGTTSIVVPAGATLADIVNAINTNPDIGGFVTASIVVDLNGDPQLDIVANNAGEGIVMNNVVGDVLGELGMNNFFTGTGASDMAVRADILTDPSKVATANMRATDGGVSFNDNRNVLELAKMADLQVSFNAAGGLSARTDNIAGYFISITTNLAVSIDAASDRVDFANTIMTDYESRNASISGVNMDEELSKLLIFQNAFQASARVISVVDEMMETIIGMV